MRKKERDGRRLRDERNLGRKNRGRCLEVVVAIVMSQPWNCEEIKGHHERGNGATIDGQMRKLRKKLRMEGR